jgi:hypothetical protein
MSSPQDFRVRARVFVPFSDDLLECQDIAPLGDLVPFHLDYRCLRSSVRQSFMTSMTPAATTANAVRDRIPEVATG